MSHFSVLVIGDNVEDQLALYNENLNLPKYVKYTREELIEKSKKEVEEYATKGNYAQWKADPKMYESYCTNNDAHLNYLKNEFPKKLEWTDEEHYEHAIRYYEEDEIGENGEVYSTYNPKSKWDWYELGGRWTGFLKLKKEKVALLVGQVEGFTEHEINNFIKISKEDPKKFNRIVSKYKGKEITIRKIVENFQNPNSESILPPHIVGKPGIMTEPVEKGYADQCQKRYIDFEGMRDEAEKEARWRYQTIAKFYGGTIPQLNHTWQELIDENGKYAKLCIEEKREMYHIQPPLKKLKEEYEYISSLPKKERDLLIWFEYEKYLCTEDEYAQKMRDEAIQTFAVVKDGKWYERGEMGWWACVHNKKNDEDWNKEFNKLIDNLPEETLFTIVDCHI